MFTAIERDRWRYNGTQSIARGEYIVILHQSFAVAKAIHLQRLETKSNFQRDMGGSSFWVCGCKRDEDRGEEFNR